jgi:hypothetical protein
MSKDTAVTTVNHRDYYCAQGWYHQPVRNKWARITVDKVKIMWADKDYEYNYQLGDYVFSLAKEHWTKVRHNEVPLAVHNRLEA